jgi:hypothetical protein
MLDCLSVKLSSCQVTGCIGTKLFEPKLIGVANAAMTAAGRAALMDAHVRVPVCYLLALIPKNSAQKPGIY